MARAEEAVRRSNFSNSNISNSNLTSSYIDNFIDVSELPPSSVLYELTLNNHINEDDFPNTAIVAVPSNFKQSKAKGPPHERVYFCSECGASFSNASNLKSHIRTHTGEKPYTCKYCDAAFIQSSNLKVHQRIHTGEKPFKCDECGKSFRRSSHLTGHKSIHSSETPYTCTICNKSFNQSNQLRVHMTKHNADKHVCGFCEKVFSQESSLIVHVQIHKGERPYVCGDCSAAFRSKEDLNIHKRLHFGDIYPYTCNICGRGFKILVCCTRHMEKCEKEKNESDQSIFVSKKRKIKRTTVNQLLSKKKINSSDKPQTYHFPEAQGDNEVCSMQVIEGSIEDGVEDEVEEHTMVFTNSEEGDSVHHVAS